MQKRVDAIPHEDEEFAMWVQRYQQKDFFLNNAISLCLFGTIGSSLPIIVNWLQLRPTYHRPWLVPVFGILGLTFGDWCNRKNAEISLKLQSEIDFYSDRGYSKGDVFGARKPGCY